MKFTKTHEWARLEGDVAIVGITDFAQKQMGDIVSIDLPKIGTEAVKGKEIAMIDSMKASSPVYSPVSGTVVETNARIDSEPQIVNQFAQSEGWLFKIKIKDPAELNDLLDEQQYSAVASEEHK